MPAQPHLKQLVVGDRIQEPLLVLEVEHRDSPKGAFTMLILGNCHGHLPTAPFWAEDQPRLAGIERGTVAQVIGEVGQYNGKRQLKVSSIRVLPRAMVDWRQFLPCVADVAPYWERLDRWRGEVCRPRLRRTLDLFYDDPEFRRRYEACPASTAGHHAELGGLLRHTCEVASIGRAIAKVCRAEADVVLAGALLHDIGKLEAYRWEGGFENTERGTLLGHVTLGMLMLDRRVAAEAEAPCTERELAILHHLIASHHGKQEFGAPVAPMTLEAEVLHFADNASAKTASMSRALAEVDNFEGDALVSARTLWTLDRRRAYRGRSDWGVGAEG
ncbi:MAG: HD domain-containing protein [Gemmatimonadota bacterium]|nr:HD domain-containing protein [Gemmatimonadota bacterium]